MKRQDSRGSRIFTSLDFWIATVAACLLAFWFPYWLPNGLAKDYYGIGISVLSIVFSVFFAALAVIITASDDDFVAFLDAEGDYTELLLNFRFSLGLLFCALIYSLVLYAYTSARISRSVERQHSLFVVVFGFLFLWGLFAAFNSAYDAIKYAEYRKKFLEKQRRAATGAAPTTTPHRDEPH